MGTLFVAWHLSIFLLFALTEGQNLSKERMMEIFQNTSATEADIAELVSNVNANETVEGKQEAAAQWVRDILADNENATSYESHITDFIGNLSLANNFVLESIRLPEHEEGVEGDEYFQKLKDQYLIDLEHYGNDVWCAVMKFHFETVYSGFDYPTRSHTLYAVSNPYPPKRKDFYRWQYLKDVRSAFRVLAWRKLYENLNLRNKNATEIESSLTFSLHFQREKFGFRDYTSYADWIEQRSGSSEQ